MKNVTERSIARSATPRTLGSVRLAVAVAIISGLSASTTLAQTATSWAHVQSTARSGGATNVVAFPSATRSGDLIIAEVDFSAASNFISLSDSQGNLFQQVGTEQQSTSFGIKSRLYYAANIRGGSDTVTAVVSGTPAYHEV